MGLDQNLYTTYLNDIKNNLYTLFYVPNEFKTYELCLEAVKHQGSAIFCVPENILSYEIYLEAVKGGLSLEFVPKKFKTNEFLDSFKTI